MPLAPDIVETLARARGDLRMGVPVVLSPKARPDALIAAAETLSPARLAALRTLGSPVLAITARRAETLKARAYDGDLARLRLPQRPTSPGSLAVADPADDLIRPLTGPHIAERGGRGKAASRRSGAGQGCAALARGAGGRNRRRASGRPGQRSDTISTSSPPRRISARSRPLHTVISARVPLAGSEAGRLHVFRPEDGAEEHYAVEIGRPPRDSPVLARLHSACFTGDLLGSLKCDCGPQLKAALATMGAEGAGVLLYLNQEGRGIGLANKMRAYSACRIRALTP
jgi:GTP cyclohydrolase II